mgnify:CR=1 FL=1
MRSCCEWRGRQPSSASRPAAPDDLDPLCDRRHLGGDSAGLVEVEEHVGARDDAEPALYQGAGRGDVAQPRRLPFEIMVQDAVPDQRMANGLAFLVVAVLAPWETSAVSPKKSPSFMVAT